MVNMLKMLFSLSLAGFIILGLLLVLGQILGLFIQNGSLIIMSDEYLSPVAFSLSAIAAIIGFILHYMKEK